MVTESLCFTFVSPFCFMLSRYIRVGVGCFCNNFKMTDVRKVYKV